LIGIFTLMPTPAKAQQIVDAKMQPTCTGFNNLQFTATKLQASTEYTAVYTVISVCPGSTTPTTNTISVNFTTPATITGTPSGAPFTTGDYIQVGNPTCSPTSTTYCEDDPIPNLPPSGAAVNYSSSLGIYGPLSLNALNPSTNNGCGVYATATLTANPSSVFTVDVEGHFGPSNLDILACVVCLAAPINQAIQIGASFAAIGLEGSTFQLSSGPLQVNGDLGIGADGRFHLSGGATLNATLFADPTAQVQIDGGSGLSGGIVTESMSAFQAAAINLSNSAAALSPTQTFSQIVSALTIRGNGGQNVISVPGTFHLSGGNNLTISGGASDTFIFNVPGGLQLDGGANILLSGLSPGQVLFNFPGSSGQVQTSGKADTAGIFLDPLKQMQINGGVHNSEFISGGQLSFQSNPQVTAPVCTF
jgi:hypothetical protein